MPDEILDRYTRIAMRFTEVLTSVPAEDGDRDSPCPGWTARDVAQHVVDTHWRVVARVRESEEGEGRGEIAERWQAATRSVQAALGDPRLATTEVGGMFGAQTFETLISHLLCSDTLVHTWDLARACGLDDTLDEDACRKALEFLEPHDQMMRSPGGFAAKVSSPPDADIQTRLLNFCGREV